MLVRSITLTSTPQSFALEIMCWPFDIFAMNAVNFDVNIEAIDIIHINSIKNQTKYS